MSYLDGLLRNHFSVDAQTFYQRTNVVFTSGNVTLLDVPSENKIEIAVDTSNLPGEDGVLTSSADLDVYAPSTTPKAKGYLYAAQLTTSSTSANQALPFNTGDTPLNLGTYDLAVIQASAIVLGGRNASNYCTRRVSRSWVVDTPTVTAGASTSDDGAVTAGDGAGTCALAWSVSHGPIVTVTPASASSTTWAAFIQVSILVVSP